MFIKTVSTTSGINPIKFDETGGVFYWILNTGLSTVYASTKLTFTAGDDGVVSLGPKESRRLETNNDTIYILGEGQVEIHNQRDGICSFKQAPTSSGSGGGGAIDAYSKTESDAKYASKALYGDTTINVGRKAETDVGEYSTAEGYNTTASGASSHAEGSGAISSRFSSHAEGVSTTASATASHAEGGGTIASGIYSHSEGYGTTASGKFSHAGGHHTQALKEAEFAHGKFNQSNEDTIYSIGDGTADDARHNAFEITTTGGKLHDKDIATTDLIPTELPANGGNADTVGLRNSHDFLGRDYVYPSFAIYGFGADLNNYVTDYHGFIYNCDNSPIAHDCGFLDVSFYKGGVVLQKFSRTDNCVFTRIRGANVWTDWKEISTTPIKKMTFPSMATNVNGGGNLFATDFGTPITIACTSRIDTQCTPFFAASLWYVLAKDAITLDPIPSGSYTFEVWYI